MQRDARLVRRVHRRERGTPVHAGEPAGIAVGEHVDRLPATRAADPFQYLAAVPADRRAGGHVLLGDCGSLRIRTLGPARSRLVAEHALHARQRPAQVDGRRPGAAEQLDGRGETHVAAVAAHRQRDAVGRSDADQRRAAHDHAADRRGGIRSAAQCLQLEGEGQPRLVDDGDGPAVCRHPDRAPWLALDAHQPALMAPPGRARQSRPASRATLGRAPRDGSGWRRRVPGRSPPGRVCARPESRARAARRAAAPCRDSRP